MQQAVPEDEGNLHNFALTSTESLQKVKNIINREFEKEIEMKTQELSILEERLHEAEELVTIMNISWGHRIFAVFWSITILVELPLGPAPRPFGLRSNHHMKAYRKTPLNAAGPLFAKTSTGFVRLACPTCQRPNFHNKLGFVNHCRIQHNIKFSSYEDASLHCGVPVVLSIRDIP